MQASDRCYTKKILELAKAYTEAGDAATARNAVLVALEKLRRDDLRRARALDPRERALPKLPEQFDRCYTKKILELAKAYTEAGEAGDATATNAVLAALEKLRRDDLIRDDDDLRPARPLDPHERPLPKLPKLRV